MVEMYPVGRARLELNRGLEVVTGDRRGSSGRLVIYFGYRGEKGWKSDEENVEMHTG